MKQKITDNNILTRIFTIYFICLIVLIYLYITHEKHRNIISGIISILSGTSIAVSLFSIINNEQKLQFETDKKSVQDYAEFINSSFDKIDGYYLSYPKELHSLFYEFYGNNSFPQNENISENNKINTIEYITILKIIQHIYLMYIINNNIFEDVDFRNRISNYLNSRKFKYIFARNKNNYSDRFIKYLLNLNFITEEELRVNSISIPSIGSSIKKIIL